MSRHATVRHRHRRRHRRRRRGTWAVVAVLTTATVATLSIAGLLRPERTERAGRQVSGPSTGAASATRSASPAPVPSPRTTPTADQTPTRRTASIPTAGNGEFNVAAGTSPVVGSAPDVIRYRVEVEEGLPYDSSDFAMAVDTTLADGRGWTSKGRDSFQRTPDGSVRVLLATPSTTDRLCAPLKTQGKVSCRNGNLVVINADRWAFGAEAFGDDLTNYRIYVVNHEMGHRLGFGHTSCPAPNRKAPVMLQQTIGLDGCKANPWP